MELRAELNVLSAGTMQKPDTSFRPKIPNLRVTTVPYLKFIQFPFVCKKPLSPFGLNGHGRSGN